ncbi:class I SAM-dependent methyltransferase, partial [candidate division KSB1 bacterium]|nr:class I SAM-dependent methyltransferase [candidate division KSB1 bacterium]
MATDLKDQWESTYKRKSVTGLGWYENNPAPSLKLLQQCKLSRDDSIVDIGTGASTFIDSLVEAGFKNITAVDISKTAIKKLKDRLGREKASNIKWIIEDITKPEIIFNSGEFFLWHDRAILHFLTDSNDSSTYLSVLKKLLKKNGFAI